MRKLALALFSIGLTLPVVGCAAKKPPSETMSAADLAIRKADEAEAGRDAALDIRLARDKLTEARGAVEEKEYERARRLAEQALVDAQLAESKARSAQARKTAAEIQRSIDALRMETERQGRQLESDDE